MNRLLSLIVIIFGIFSLGLGVFFVYQGVSKSNYLITNIQAEKINLGLTPEQIAAGNVDSSADQLQTASDKIRSDRHNIAATYDQLLKGGRFDPTNPQELTWAQALNMENSLNLAILAFGVTQIAEGVGAFMILVAIALWATGIVLWRLSSRKENLA
jgi:hypothetical protein